jgi:hypothetical protein
LVGQLLRESNHMFLNWKWITQVAIGTAVVLVIVAAYGKLHYGSLIHAFASWRGDKLVVDAIDRLPENVSGDRKNIDNSTSVEHRRLLRFRLNIYNLDDESVTLLGSSASCGCVSIEGTPCKIEPRASQSVDAVIVPSKTVRPTGVLVRFFTNNKAESEYRYMVPPNMLTEESVE